MELNSKTFTLFSQEKDAVVLRDFAAGGGSLSFKRSAAKRTKDFPGMEKTEVKFTTTDPVTGVVGIITVSSSIRADASAAVRNAMIGVADAALSNSAYSQLVLDQRLPLAG